MSLIKKANEHIVFHSLLIEIQLYTFFVVAFSGNNFIHQKVLNKIKDISITHNTFTIQDNEFIMCGYCCIAFIEYILPGKALLEYTKLFYPNDYQKNEKIIYHYFNDKYVKSPV